MRAEDPIAGDLFSVSHRSGGSRRAITGRRLRATLRLLFEGRTADDIAGPVGAAALDVEALSAVASRARSQYLLERVLGRLPRRGSTDDERPLPASAGVSGRAAVALAFHTGLGLDVGTIAEVLESSAEQVGADLFQARRAIDLSLPVPCERFTATVSMLNDRSLDADERLQYISHAQSCERCPVVVEAMAALDAELRAEVDRHEQSLPDAPLRARRSRRLLPVVGGVLVAAVAIAGMLVLSGLLSGSREPVPLIVGEVAPRHTGWLIQRSTDGRIEAVNLATLDAQPLSEWGMDSMGPMPVLSPGLERAALWYSNADEFILTVADVDGGVIQNLSFDRAEAAWWHFAGWLGDDELLIVESPLGPAGETEDAFFERLAEESRLHAIDATSGSRRLLFQGNVASAVVSPDRTRVAIIAPRDQRWPGESFELRQMSAEGVGDLIASVEHRMDGTNGPGMWSPDSSRFLFTRIADEVVEPIEFAPGQVFSSTSVRYEQLELAALDRDGARSTIFTPEPGQPLDVAAVSPDSQTVIFHSGTDQTEGYFRYIFWHIPVAGGEPEQIFESPHPNGVWSPDGMTLLWPTVTSWYLSGDATDALGRVVPDNAFVAYGPDWEPRTVHGEGSPNPKGPRVLAWLPEEALPMTVEADRPVEIRGQAAEAAPVVNAGTGNKLFAGSAASPDGQYVTLRTADDEPVIWNGERRQGRRQLDGAGGGVWLPSGDGLIDTATRQSGGAATRLIFYAPQFTRAIDARYDFRMLNPAGLAELGAQHYAAPRLSPGQFNASFFVIDPEQRAVSLWVAGWDTEPRQVLRWLVPGDRLLDVPLEAVWADERTLLVAQPGDWRDGLPRKATLTRIVVDGDEVAVEPLVELNTRPRDHGVILWEMELSPDGSQIAYRLRHYGELAVEGGRTDVLHVVDVADIGRPLELTRGAPGEGLAWSKDSRWLVAGTRGQIALMSTDGRELSFVTPEGARADHPIWMSTHEVWFSLDSGNGLEIWRVRVD